MKTYRVLRDCVGFKRKMWYQDQIVELEDDEKPPHHFELIKGQPAPKIEENKPSGTPLSATHNKPQVKYGMGYKSEETKTKIYKTQGMKD